MAMFESGGVRLNYEDRGSGEAVILLHGFGMSAQACWLSNGWPEALSSDELRVVALDSRGHGASEKPHHTASYGAADMTSDVVRLMDHLDIQLAHVIGHSMGARTAFALAQEESDRVLSVTAISLGSNLFEQVQPGPLIKALGKEDRSALPPGLVALADKLLAMDNDPDALVACASAPRPLPRREDLAELHKPVLTVCGGNDVIVGDPMMLKSVLPRAQAIVLDGRDHESVLADPECLKAVREFIKHSAGDA